MREQCFFFKLSNLTKIEKLLDEKKTNNAISLVASDPLEVLLLFVARCGVCSL
jgi:hypothetical protein